MIGLSPGSRPGPGAADPLSAAAARRSRRGASLAEVLVAVTVLAVGGAAATQLLVRAAHDLDGAELGLRAVLMLAEVEREGPPPEGESGPGTEGSARGGEATLVRPAGPGNLTVEWEGNWPTVRYDPPSTAARGEVGTAGPGGYREARAWRLRGEP